MNYFIGVDINKTNKCIFVFQNKYTKKLLKNLIWKNPRL